MTESHRETADAAYPAAGAVGSQVFWARVRIDVGKNPQPWRAQLPAFYRGEIDTAPVESGNTKTPASYEMQVREQLETIIEALRNQQNVPSHEYTDEELRSVDELAQDSAKFDSLIEQIMGTETTEEHHLLQTTGANESDPASNGTEGDGPGHWELNPDVLAYLQALPEVTAVETAQGRAQVYFLCENVPEAPLPRTVLAHSDGRLKAGRPLEVVYRELCEAFPGLEGQTGGLEIDYLHLANFSLGTDAVGLDPQGISAALVEASMADLAAHMKPTVFSGIVQAAPADRGWSLVTADSRTLAALLQALNVPAIIAEHTFFAQNLAFVLPADSTEPVKGSVADWASKVMGTPDTPLMGTVLTFSWSPVKKILSDSSQPNTDVGNLVWDMPGRLPDPYQELAARENLEQLTWFYGLDERTANRLANYVLDYGSTDGLESTLHALELPDELLKVLTGAVTLDEFVGYREFAPDMTGLGRLKQAVTAYPNGTDPVSSVSRELLQRPWLVKADAAAQLGASGALALWGARRASQGRSGRAALVAAATLGALGATELVIARAHEKLSDQQQMPVQNLTARPLSLTEELRAQHAVSARRAEEPTVPKFLRNAKKLGAQAGEQTRVKLGRFFGLAE
ncbi:hypothetical protein [Rothia nasisuis]|uniref:hypothetical protein n=1 Tax=Rothia nasisuis TaxID=2109647 RepID=UPI001F283B05|nr:hypothetical protein [Rothia nasisuis]